MDDLVAADLLALADIMTSLENLTVTGLSSLISVFITWEVVFAAAVNDLVQPPLIKARDVLAADPSNHNILADLLLVPININKTCYKCYTKML